MKVLLVDDHPLFLSSYKSILETSFSHLNCLTANTIEDAKKIFQRNPIDLIILDVEMHLNQRHVENGVDLGVFMKTSNPELKIVIITSHIKSLILYDIQKKVHPQGIITKVDCDPTTLKTCIQVVLDGGYFLSTNVKLALRTIIHSPEFLDSFNRQIILLLLQGVQTKNMHLHIPLSLSAIDKRKAYIKEILNVTNGNDEDILKCAKELGLI